MRIYAAIKTDGVNICVCRLSSERKKAVGTFGKTYEERK
jgi:hypothetical protein